MHPRGPARPGRQRALAFAWLLLLLAAVAASAWRWQAEHRVLETDILALLPANEEDPLLRHVVTTVATAAQQDLVVLVGAPSWDVARTAADAYAEVLARDTSLFAHVDAPGPDDRDALQLWWSHRHALLTDEDRQRLDTASPAALARRAVQELATPMGTARVGTWQEDPFATFQHWVRLRAAASPVRPMDGHLRVDDAGTAYVVVLRQLRAPPFSLGTQRRAIPVLDAAKRAARSVDPSVRVLSAGLLFPADAASRQARFELSTIGWGSIVGILLLNWFAFRSLRPLGLLLLSIGTGTLAALAVTAWCYPRLHLLTLVFGSSLIGVAQDYALHFLAVTGPARPVTAGTIRRLLPSLALALLTTIGAFAGLALSPFPGLQQIAVFSATGLTAAWLTVVLWFPVLRSGPGLQPALLAQAGALQARWQRLARRLAPGLLAVGIGVVGAGAFRLHHDDDIRRLQNLPAAMLDEQVQVGRIMRQPFSGQLLIVTGTSAEEVLRREEALRVHLDSLVERGVFAGYAAVSAFVPSRERQARDAQLVAQRLYGPGAALDTLAALIEAEPGWARAVRDARPRPGAPLDLDTWARSPLAGATRTLWLGQVESTWLSAITFIELPADAVPAIRRVVDGQPGVRWADQVEGISSTLQRYRIRMGWGLLVTYALVWLLFVPRHGRRAWRLVAPSALASLLALAIVSLAGSPVQLFHVLALYLVFGIGIDAAVFLTERHDTAASATWAAVVLAALSTLLSLGLLALSGTPVLRAFGLTMLLGVTGSLLLAPLLCRPRSAALDTGARAAA